MTDATSCNRSLATAIEEAEEIVDVSGDLNAAGLTLPGAQLKGGDAPDVGRPADAISEKVGPKLELINGASIQPEAVRWCWSGWLALGKFHLLAGAAGTGKTTIALALAAAITSGGRCPNGDVIESGDVVIWSGEDGASDTLMPRFLAMGGDPTRLYIVGAVCDGVLRRPFDPAVDMERLAEAATALPALKLVIVDPVSAAVTGDSHKNAETRRSLQPLVDFAAERDCVVLGITHFAKGTAGREPLERVLGSVAFGALARVVMATMRPANADAPRRLVRVKSNLGPDGDGVEYTLSDAPVPASNIDAQRVEWGQHLLGTARALMAEDQAERHRAARSECKAFLLDILRDGPVPQKDISAAADAHGHSPSTIKRAKKELGVRTDKPTFKGGWYWDLPSGGPIAEEDQET